MVKRRAKKKSKPARKTKPRAKARARRPGRHKPESLRLREVAVSLTVADLDRSTAWYRDVLGFTEGERWEDSGRALGVQLKAGNVELMLSQDDLAKGRDRAKGAGVRLWATTAQDLDQLATMITSRGGALAQEPGELAWGGRAFALTDPDGYAWTVIQA